MNLEKWDLKKVPDDWLLEELIRRRNNRTDTKPEHWCHDCAHFQAWNEAPRAGACPDTFNPCTKGHSMKFIVPADYGDDYGFYRRICGDRDSSQADTAPA